jgi:hypothetical protein
MMHLDDSFTLAVHSPLFAALGVTMGGKKEKTVDRH